MSLSVFVSLPHVSLPPGRCCCAWVEQPQVFARKKTAYLCFDASLSHC